MYGEPATNPLRFEILGVVRAFRGGRQLDLGPAKQRAVLAVLLLNPGRPVPTHRIVDAVWGDEPPENGPNVVQKYVAGLRRVLDPDRSPRTPGEMLALTDGGYVLRAASLDAEDFRNGLARADAERRAGRLEEAARLARTALELWNGEALGGLTGPLFDSARTRLVEERASAWEMWAEIELSRGGFAGLVSELSRLVQEFPLREGLRAQLMIALHRSGRQAEALAVFRDAREYLLDELGVEPGERLQETHRQILRNEPPAPPTAVHTPAAVHIPAPRPPADPMPAAVQPYSPAPPPHALMPGLPFAPRRHGISWAEVILAAVLPLATCSMGSWFYFAYAAFQRRTIRDVLVAVGYFFAVIGVLVFLVIDPSDPNSELASDAETIGFLLGLGLIALAAFHGAFLAVFPGDSRRARRQRDMARMYATFHPDAARQAGIGRPDLMRSFDDGGLVDLNHAPAQEIARLHGINPIEAHRIAVDRYERGPYRAPDDLVVRGLLRPKTLQRLEPWLICVPPAMPARADAPGPDPV
ncbi:BTAD domain-containing putative transcriptional regulator [Actinoplanes italicus]|uniref:DNA-binding SARP family transcriptional activator n=1 Tax=Actinoplanes italicus TaxID=113567 RepID=A0A2T0KNU7_9ACTN|nr:BTAD domain-containing putative transcriptional regulator [Actinoplanes italicus]PRX25407.1 DNA-binding SARP family transcriptional activator [Actinoplanes italicus]